MTPETSRAASVPSPHKMTIDRRSGVADRLARLRILFASVALALPLWSGCPGSLDPAQFPRGAGGSGPPGNAGTGGTTAPSCDAPTLYFKATNVTGCGFPGVCHDAMGATFSKLNLADANPWSRLLNKPAMSVDGPGCMGMPLVDGANRMNSVILKRLGGETCGKDTLMPQGVVEPEKAILDCVTAWVLAQ